MIPLADIRGFVLAGGRSSRFGSDKALHPVGGKPLLAHALDAIRELGLVPSVVAPDARPYAALADAFVTGERPGHGPLEGLRAALAACTAPWALVLSADMPGVQARVLARLVHAAHVTCDAVVFADTAGRRHPFPGLYAASLRAAADALPGDAAMAALLDAARVRVADPGDARAVLRNVNRPEDL